MESLSNDQIVKNAIDLTKMYSSIAVKQTLFVLLKDIIFFTLRINEVMLFRNSYPTCLPVLPSRCVAFCLSVHRYITPRDNTGTTYLPEAINKQAKSDHHRRMLFSMSENYTCPTKKNKTLR